MDGVLLDTERLWGRAEVRLCAAHGVDHGPEDEAATLGVLVLEACRHYARRFGLPDEAAPILEAELLALMAEELDGPVEPLPGAADLVARLRGRVRLGVASNSRRIVVERAVAKANVREVMDVVVSADDVARPKPAPDLYRLACDRLGVDPADALALEDSPVGASAAVAAGMSCYLVGPALPKDAPPVDAWIPSLVRLLAPAPRRARSGCARRVADGP
jgi:HAD superfamily hydrolase (TIGR01509 family)